MAQKTIFISLSDVNVFRNLFFFPKSLFHQMNEALKSRKDLRVVYILPKTGDRFKTFLEQFKNDQFSIEEIEGVSKKKETFLQKVFYFFYAYFIYTDTTRMLATMGMRPGEPLGGGKRYLAPVKALIAKTFGRSQWMRDVAVPFLFYKIFPERSFQDLFDTYHPDMVFTPNLFMKFDVVFLAEAKKQGTHTVGMISNWDHFDKYYIPFRTDILLAQSEQVKRFALKYQSYAPDAIRLVGYPHFDFITDTSRAISRQEILKLLNFPPDSKYILYVSGSSYCPDEPDIIEKILEWADQGKFGFDVRLFIRPYLGSRSADRDFDEKKFKRFKEHPRVVFYEETFWGDVTKSANFFNVIRHADAAVVIYSTMLLEIAALDRPLVLVTFDGYTERPFDRSIRRFGLREHFKDVFDTKGVAVAENFNHLFTILDAYLKDPSKDSEKRKELCDTLLYKLDSCSTKRIINTILENEYR